MEMSEKEDHFAGGSELSITGESLSTPSKQLSNLNTVLIDDSNRSNKVIPLMAVCLEIKLP
jgi:hypothetical protein